MRDPNEDQLPPFVPEPAPPYPVLAALADGRLIAEHIGRLLSDLTATLDHAERQLAGGRPARDRAEDKARREARAAERIAAQVQAISPVIAPSFPEDRGGVAVPPGSQARSDKLCLSLTRGASPKSGGPAEKPRAARARREPSR